MTQRLGFIGVGTLGVAMVERLLARGWPVSVWNREPERYDLVAPLGAEPLGSPAEVAAASDVVMTCVLDGPAVEACCFGPGGIAEAKGGAGALIDFSTISPEDSVDFAARLAAANGMAWLDAPVSGGPPAARTGGLAIMAGGDPAVFAHCRPILADLAGTLTHMGPLGAGQTTKILNQALVGVGYVLMAEVLALVESTEIDAASLPACLAGGMADSTVLQRIYPLMAARDFANPMGYARQLDKDLKAVLAFAAARGLDLPVLRAAIGQYRAYVGAGNEMADSASVSELYRARN